eukprot:2022833-Pyramimonas_sp.AAC.1
MSLFPSLPFREAFGLNQQAWARASGLAEARANHPPWLQWAAAATRGPLCPQDLRLTSPSKGPAQ